MESRAGLASPLHAAAALRYNGISRIRIWELAILFAGAYAIGNLILQRKRHREKEREETRERARQKRARNPLYRFLKR